MMMSFFFDLITETISTVDEYNDYIQKYILTEVIFFCHVPDHSHKMKQTIKDIIVEIYEDSLDQLNNQNPLNEFRFVFITQTDILPLDEEISNRLPLLYIQSNLQNHTIIGTVNKNYIIDSIYNFINNEGLLIELTSTNLLNSLQRINLDDKKGLMLLFISKTDHNSYHQLLYQYQEVSNLNHDEIVFSFVDLGHYQQLAKKLINFHPESTQISVYEESFQNHSLLPFVYFTFPDHIEDYISLIGIKNFDLFQSLHSFDNNYNKLKQRDDSYIDYLMDEIHYISNLVTNNYGGICLLSSRIHSPITSFVPSNDHNNEYDYNNQIPTTISFNYDSLSNFLEQHSTSPSSLLIFFHNSSTGYQKTLHLIYKEFINLYKSFLIENNINFGDYDFSFNEYSFPSILEHQIKQTQNNNSNNNNNNIQSDILLLFITNNNNNIKPIHQNSFLPFTTNLSIHNIYSFIKSKTNI
eukprot:TRINITY_DN2349_c1_g1_i1.p1 TRINITY_DN2349_c1_g1~~TRINITY_DN2349_c1_g1_i1.p1  ORF type:complete len:467 (-),score=52.38 TRINITY_DN2349_c1_g1_i1:7-1407(-)